MKLSVKCDHCGEKFNLSSELVKEEEVIFADGKKATITFFNCVCCGAKYIVMIDDNITRKWLALLKSEMRKASLEKKRDGNVSEKRKKKLENYRICLKQSRDKLRELYDGELYTDSNGLSHTFSITFKEQP